MNRNIFSFFRVFIFVLVFCVMVFTFSCTSDDDDDNDNNYYATVTSTPTIEFTFTPTPVQTSTPTPTPDTGYLSIASVDQDQNQIDGEIFVDGFSVGIGSWSGQAAPGDYAVSFGYLVGYTSPADQVVTVIAGETTPVEGIYSEAHCSFDNVFVNDQPYNGDKISVRWDGGMYIDFYFEHGLYWDAWTTCNPPLFGPDHGEGVGYYSTWLADPGAGGCWAEETFYLSGTGYFGDCHLEIPYYVW